MIMGNFLLVKHDTAYKQLNKLLHGPKRQSHLNFLMQPAARKQSILYLLFH